MIPWVSFGGVKKQVYVDRWNARGGEVLKSSMEAAVGDAVQQIDLQVCH
jgi:hypothetical protein